MDRDSEELVREYLPLAQSLALQVWRTAPHALELDELKAIANLGLVGAAARWRPYCAENQHDPNRLEYFKPFVVRRVYGSLMDAIRQSDWATRSLRTKAKALQEAGQDKSATEADLAARTGMTVKEIRATKRGMSQRRPVSLEDVELDPPSTQDVESAVFTSFMLATVVRVIRGLADEQQIVVALRYHQGMQLQEIAKAMGITESRASQLHARAVTAIHEAMVQAAKRQDDTC